MSDKENAVSFFLIMHFAQEEKGMGCGKKLEDEAEPQI